MNRDEIRDRFSSLLDGELEADERAEIEAVLAQDAELLRELDSLKRVDLLYRALPKPTAPEGFEADVRERVHPPRIALPMHHARRRVWPALAAAAILVVTVGFVVIQMQTPGNNFDLASTSTPAAPAPSASASSEMSEKVSEGLIDHQDIQKLESLGYAGTAPMEAEHKAEADSAGARADSPVPASAAAPVEVQAVESPSPLQDMSINTLGKTVEPESTVGMRVQELKKEKQTNDFGEVAAEAPPMPASKPVLSAKAAAEASVDVETPKPAAPPAVSRWVMKQEDRAMTEESALGGIALQPTTPRRIANRDFDLRDGVFYQRGYNGEPTVPVVRGTKTADDLKSKHDGFDEIFRDAKPFVFKLGDRWYKLSSPE
ncbi:MAG: hypothetical protein SGI88_11560 [Candidatus Hydrogenedentes bacterium]|nr:hypothetical protein [Candidatus Hydrogenedentota bacterium]